MFPRDARAFGYVNTNDLAGAEEAVEAPGLHARRVEAVMIGSVHVGAQMNRAMKRRKRQIVAALHVQQDFAPDRRVAGPDFERFGDRRCDVVYHWPLKFARTRMG